MEGTIIVLTEEAFARARDFIRRHARPLDRARFRFHFKDGGSDDVWQYLKHYQNADGGFGRAIEPDIRAPESSALGTSIALRIVREIVGRSGVDTPDTLVRSAIKYLLATFDEDMVGWRIVPASVERSPHAPWWKQSGREDVFDAFSLNPNAELLGHLLDYPDLAPAELLDALSAKVMQSIAAADGSAEPLEMHELLCCKSLAESDGLDERKRDEIVATLSRQLDRVVGGPDEWGGYSLRPLQVADSPDSLFYAPLQHIISENLDYEIAHQQPDGSWAPTWSWGDDHQYPRVWEAAKFEWAGMLTVDTLVVLKRYGKIAGNVK